MAEAIAACATQAQQKFVAETKVLEWDAAAEAALWRIPHSLVAQHVQSTTLFGGKPNTVHTVIIARAELLVLAIHCLGMRAPPGIRARSAS